jgi:hypothetical protein
LISIFFPPVETETEANEATEAKSEPTEGQETSTEPSELLSQLPDAPTDEPQDAEDSEQPAVKKQKTTDSDADDDFVVVEKEDANEDAQEDAKEEVEEAKPKSEL